MDQIEGGTEGGAVNVHVHNITSSYQVLNVEKVSRDL